MATDSNAANTWDGSVTDKATGAVTERKIYRTHGAAWLHSCMRRQYQQVVFAPGESLPSNVHNLWRGFAYVGGKLQIKLHNGAKRFRLGLRKRIQRGPLLWPSLKLD